MLKFSKFKIFIVLFLLLFQITPPLVGATSSQPENNNLEVQQALGQEEITTDEVDLTPSQQPDNGHSSEESKEKTSDSVSQQVQQVEKESNEQTEEKLETELEELRGVALQKTTNVYAEPELGAPVLTSYQEGDILKFHRYDSDWYTLTIEINGENQTGYLHSKDIDIITSESKRLEGAALKQPVAIYATPSQNSEILKTYNYNHRLIYRSFSSQWHIATVYINGKPKTGYIFAKNVGEQDQSKSVRGIALANKTHVYSKTSRNSKVLKSYNKGHILKYRSYDSDWFIATVYLNGKSKTGFIHAKDVETEVTTTSHLQGVGGKSPTRVYSNASRNSRVLKSYKYGHILKFRSFTSDWYEATVFINGKAHTGYINHSDVKDKNALLSGFAIANPTTVYSSTSKNSSKLKSYKKGHILKYRAHDSNWLNATVYINGKARTGYIHVKDVSPNAPSLTGYAAKSPTSVYSSRSKSSTKLKSYSRGHLLKFKPYNKDWYRATVYVNGKARTGYIYVKDVTNQSPLIKGYAIAKPTYVYSKTSKSSKKLKSYARGRAIQYRPFNNSWYIATIYVKGQKHTGYIHKNDAGIVNPHKTYTYNNMASDIKKLKNAYPDLITYKSVGKSEYGRNIYAISIGKGNATAFINGSHHAREWLTTNLNMYMIEEYAKAYERNSKIGGYSARSILNSTTLWFIPMVNPDGVTLQQHGLQAFPKSTHNSLIRMNNGSKNFKRWKANAKGVDLNRQYNAGWATIKNNPGKPYYENYKGKSPHTAAETKAVLKLVNEINPQIAVSYHSSGRILYWNYKQPPANYSRDHIYAKRIGKLTGYSLVYPGPNPSGGGFTDWFIHTKKRPAFTPEISPYVGPTNVPLSEFPRVWRENRAVGLYVGQESAKLYRK